MKERARLIKALGSARGEMRAVLAQVDPEREIYPGWGAKQLLAHLTGWDEAVSAALRAHLDGDAPVTPAVDGIDPYNAESVATREALSFEQVVGECEQARRALLAVVREIPVERWDETHLFAWGERGTVRDELAILIHHEREHVQEIRALLA